MAGSRGPARRGGAVLAACMALALAACNGPDPEPTTSPSSPGTASPPSSSPPPTETPTETARPTDRPTVIRPPDEIPERPAGMSDEGEIGAIAAAKYFMELYPYVYATGDLEPWRAMSHPECVFCQSVIDNVEELHASGGQQVGGELEWLGGVAYEFHTQSRVHDVRLSLLQSEIQVLDRAGAVDRVIDAANHDLAVLLRFDREGWTVRGVDVDPE